MTYKDLQDRVMAFGYGEADREHIKVWVNMAYLEICARSRWGFLESSAQITTTPGEQAVDIADIGDTPVTIFGQLRPDSPTPSVAYVSEVSATELATQEFSDRQGMPRRYSIWGDQLLFYPTPDRAYPFTVRYWSLPEEMTEDDDEPVIPARFQQVILLGALMYAAERDHNDGLVMSRRAAFEDGIRRMEGAERLSQAQTVRKVPMPRHYGGMFD